MLSNSDNRAMQNDGASTVAVDMPEYGLLEVDLDLCGSQPVADLVVFYDGDCTPCRKKITWLQSLSGDAVMYVNIADEQFDPAALKAGLTKGYFFQEIRGLRSDGTFVSGLDVLRCIFIAANLSWLWLPATWPIVGALVRGAYRALVRWRYCSQRNSTQPRLACRHLPLDHTRWPH